MVLHFLPAVKLVGLFVRQIGRPMANQIVQQAKNHYYFRKYVLMPPAQAFHWCQVGLKMWALNLGWPVKIAPLSEAQAIELGASLMTECILFGTAATILYREIQRQSRNEAIKEMKAKEKLQAISQSLKTLAASTSEQNQLLADLTSVMNALGLSEKVLGKELEPPSNKIEPDEIIDPALKQEIEGNGNGGPSKRDSDNEKKGYYNKEGSTVNDSRSNDSGNETTHENTITSSSDESSHSTRDSNNRGYSHETTQSNMNDCGDKYNFNNTSAFIEDDEFSLHSRHSANADAAKNYIPRDDRLQIEKGGTEVQKGDNTNQGYDVQSKNNDSQVHDEIQEGDVIQQGFHDEIQEESAVQQDYDIQTENEPQEGDAFEQDYDVSVFDHDAPLHGEAQEENAAQGDSDQDYEVQSENEDTWMHDEAQEDDVIQHPNTQYYDTQSDEDYDTQVHGEVQEDDASPRGYDEKDNTRYNSRRAGVVH